jgi:hypothetical protein
MNSELNNYFNKITEIMKEVYTNLKFKNIIKPYKLDIPSFYQIFFIYLKHNKERYHYQILDILTYLKTNKININTNFIFIKQLNLKQLQKLHYYIEDNFKGIKRNFLYSVLNNDNNLNIPKEHMFLYNTFITFDSFEKIKRQIKYENIINYSFENIKGTIKIYTKTKTNKDINFKDIISRFLFFNKYFNNNKTPEFTIYASDLKKTLIFDNQDNNKIIRENNVNTAATDVVSRIIIWRKEELLKSIFHETVHFFKLDIIKSSQIIKHYLQQHLNIEQNTEILVREGYTEFITNILNILFIIRNNYNYKTFIEYLTREKQFSIKQNATILSYFKYKSFNDFLKHENKNDKIYTFKQNTSCISYYILKSLFLFNFEEILYNNIKNTNILKYNNNSDSDSDILLTIITSTINKDYYNTIKNKNNWINQINKYLKTKTNRGFKKHSKNKIKKKVSMKMTYFTK